MQALHSLHSTNMADNITRKYNSPRKKNCTQNYESPESYFDPLSILPRRKESGIWLLRSLTRSVHQEPLFFLTMLLKFQVAIDSTVGLAFLALQS